MQETLDAKMTRAWHEYLSHSGGADAAYSILRSLFDLGIPTEYLAKVRDLVTSTYEQEHATSMASLNNHRDLMRERHGI
jgi:hypothetical protein